MSLRFKCSAGLRDGNASGPFFRPMLPRHVASASRPSHVASAPRPSAPRRLVDQHELSCISVRCFDVVTAKETTGGWAPVLFNLRGSQRALLRCGDCQGDDWWVGGLLYLFT